MQGRSNGVGSNERALGVKKCEMEGDFNCQRDFERCRVVR